MEKNLNFKIYSLLEQNVSVSQQNFGSFTTCHFSTSTIGIREYRRQLGTGCSPVFTVLVTRTTSFWYLLTREKIRLACTDIHSRSRSNHRSRYADAAAPVDPMVSEWSGVRETWDSVESRWGQFARNVTPWANFRLAAKLARIKRKRSRARLVENYIGSRHWIGKMHIQYTRNPLTLFRSIPRRISRAGWRWLSSTATTFPSFLSITRSFAYEKPTTSHRDIQLMVGIGVPSIPRFQQSEHFDFSLKLWNQFIIYIILDFYK